jgi:hypothetical protein
MKKVRNIIICILVLVLGIGVCLGVLVVRSPEYALMNIAKDIRTDGIDGLMPHLTGKAEDTVTTITSIAENRFVNTILSAFNKDDYVVILKSNIKKVNWEIDDILKGNKQANIVLAFNYEDKLVGTIKVSMVREDDEWKISGIEMPEFKKVNLSFEK